MDLSTSHFNPPSYDKEEKTLDVYDEDGCVHRFFDVPPDVWDEFSDSTYKQLFFNDYIINRYQSKMLGKK